MDRSTTLVIRADLAEIEKVTTALEIAMRACAFTDDLIRELQLAVEEAIANTIVHGYRGAAGDVAIAIRVTPRSGGGPDRRPRTPVRPARVPGAGS